MMSVGLHCRLTGRPGRAAALARFLDDVSGHDGAWVTTRLDIARHWVRRHPPRGGYVPSRMGRALFVELFGGVAAHAPAIAERAYAGGIGPGQDQAEGLRSALMAQVSAMPPTERDALIEAQPIPDSAGGPAGGGTKHPVTTDRAGVLAQIERAAGLRLGAIL